MSVVYRDYIQSSKWRAVRKRYFASRLPKTCYVCDFAGPVDLHHRTYKNLGKERLMDLVPLCRSCHDRVHILQKGAGWDLWTATKKYRKSVRRGK